MKITLLIFVLYAFPIVAQTNAAGISQTSSHPTRHIQGQIYITRKDRETVKMSLVTVRIVDSGKFSAVLQLANSYKTAADNDAEWRERVTRLVDAMPSMSSSDRVVAGKTYAKLSSMVKTNLPYAKLGQKPYFDILSDLDWHEERSAQTDADGEFNIEVPDGSWQIVALSKRKIMDEDETYIWLVSVPSSDGRILLNNSNLLGE